VRRARLAAGSLPVMLHVGQTFSPLPKILELLGARRRRHAHLLAAAAQVSSTTAGACCPKSRAARARGIRFDVGKRPERTHHLADRRRRNARRLLARHDLIRHHRSGADGPRLRSATVVSKFLMLGHAARSGESPA